MKAQEAYEAGYVSGVATNLESSCSNSSQSRWSGW